MEGTGYGSAHLPSPALVVFSQAAGGLGEALRIQRPFHSQLQDAKDLHHLSLVGSYGAHLLHGFPPHFLHPAVTSQANTTGGNGGNINTGNGSSSGVNGGPFSGGGAFVKPFPSSIPLPSAFAPPKCVGLNGLNEQNILFSGSESFRTDSSSPACNSLSPPVKEESLEGHTSEEGDRDRICSPERSPETPGFRPPKSTNGAEPLNLRMDAGQSIYRFPFYNSFKNFHHQHQSAAGIGNIKKQPLGTPPPNACPICGTQLSSNELETHFLTELDRLYKLNTIQERQRIRASFNMNPMHSNGMLQGPDSRWETFQRIRTNRQGRQRAKARKRKGDSESDFSEHLRNAQCQTCPVCHGRLQRTPEEIAQHVEECLRKTGQSREDEDETVDVESYGDEANMVVNLTSSPNHLINHNNNNNSPKIMIPPSHTPPSRQIPPNTEEHIITSGSSPWDRKHRIAVTMNCTATNITNVSRATPTSSDQISEYEQDEHHQTTKRPIHGETEIDEEVIVDNTDDEDCLMKKNRSDKSMRNDKNSTEEATSSMEIDSATDCTTQKTTAPTPDSYVSTSEPTEPTSRAQVLEELRARIRELEGSPFKVRSSQPDEEHYKCFICKEAYRAPVISTMCWHVHCDECWITLSDVKKSCPQCKIISTINELRKIHV